MGDLVKSAVGVQTGGGGAVDGPKKILWVRVGAAAGVVVGLALAAKLIWSAVMAGVGLLALGAIALIAAAVVMSLPLMAQKFENKLLAARKAEARRNPIEELQRFLTSKRMRVEAFRQAVVQVGTQVKSLKDMVDDRLREKPGYDASKQVKSLQAMEAAHAKLVTKYDNAKRAIEQLEEVIEDKKFEYSFGQAGQAAIRSLNATSGQDLLNEMLADEAFSSVRDNFNAVFAELELEAAKLTEARTLEFDGGMSLDLSNIALPIEDQLVKVR